MTARILIVGQDADTVDYAAPGIIPGMTAEKVRAGLAASRWTAKAMPAGGPARSRRRRGRSW